MKNNTNKTTPVVSANTAPEYSGQATPEQIEAWKKEFAEDGEPATITEISVNVDKQGTKVAVCYLKPAKRETLALALTKYNRDQILEAGEVILDNCWLAGDERFKKYESKIHITGALKASSLIEFLDGSVKKN